MCLSDKTPSHVTNKHTELSEFSLTHARTHTHTPHTHPHTLSCSRTHAHNTHSLSCSRTRAHTHPTFSHAPAHHSLSLTHVHTHISLIHSLTHASPTTHTPHTHHTHTHTHTHTPHCRVRSYSSVDRNLPLPSSMKLYDDGFYDNQRWSCVRCTRRTDRHTLAHTEFPPIKLLRDSVNQQLSDSVFLFSRTTAPSSECVHLCESVCVSLCVCGCVCECVCV